MRWVFSSEKLNHTNHNEKKAKLPKFVILLAQHSEGYIMSKKLVRKLSILLFLTLSYEVIVSTFLKGRERITWITPFLSKSRMFKK